MQSLFRVKYARLLPIKQIITSLMNVHEAFQVKKDHLEALFSKSFLLSRLQEKWLWKVKKKVFLDWSKTKHCVLSLLYMYIRDYVYYNRVIICEWISVCWSSVPICGRYIITTYTRWMQKTPKCYKIKKQIANFFPFTPKTYLHLVSDQPFSQVLVYYRYISVDCWLQDPSNSTAYTVTCLHFKSLLKDKDFWKHHITDM